MNESIAGVGAPASASYRRYVLVALMVVYAFNFIDRQIIGILAVPIKAELRLSDGELGLLGGLAFGLFYTLLAIPVARLADRTGRTRILAGSLALWSLMTAACGFALGFGQLLLCRLGVGIGEAGGVSPAHALLCDYFPERERARAIGVYSFGSPVGTAIGLVAGGFLATGIGWRAAFVAVGVAGLLLAPLFAFTVREARSPWVADRAAPGLAAVLAVLARKPSFWWLAFGAACASTIGYGIYFWMPSFLVRSFALAVPDAALCFALLVLVGGIAGLWFGGALADRYGTSRKGSYALVPALAFAATGPLYLAALSSHEAGPCIGLLVLPTALGLTWLGPVLAAVQHLVPTTMRATASATFLFINNLLGLGLGSLAIGALSDAMRVRFGAESLRYAILFGTGCYLPATVCLLLAARRLARDWHG
jgi:MFS family permease